ncbi:tail assembly protein [Burkholderia phage vB_BceS_AH2]|uniref:Tail assembly protein n=1 Tax=Burkholderia phage vB_BceS_AH2 TaxID=1133022 RepID=I6NSG5_9CAUD|nr:tail assembly protein [Burkholderia phage vB_BceS_AH2]AEY69557.1 tail assembly protein [Burkholderia phage vB_BceS_AH2]
MSFLSAETSIFGGRPIELYEFKRGTQIWRFCTARKNTIFNGNVFQPTYIKRDNLRSTSANGRQALNVTVAATNPIPVSYIGGMPAQVTTLTIYRQHVGEPEVGQVWGGRIVNVEFSGDEAVLKCEPIGTALRRIGLRASYQVLCRHALFGPHCQALDNRISGNVAQVIGQNVTVGGFTLPPQAKYFAGGTMRHGDDAWLIVEQNGVVLTLSQPPIGLKSGDAISLSAGCDHTAYGENGCKKFNNLDNFGGYPFMPKRNPFGNNPIV